MMQLKRTAIYAIEPLILTGLLVLISCRGLYPAITKTEYKFINLPCLTLAEMLTDIFTFAVHMTKLTRQFLGRPLFILLKSLALLFFSGNCGAQETDRISVFAPGFGVEANMICGKVFKHEAKFTLPIPAISTGADINLFWHTYGKKTWEQRLHYPTLGIALTYINYGIDSVYGHCFGLYPNLTVPLITGRNLEWTLRMGDGIGYITRTFSRVNPADTINVAIGSHLNDMLMLMTDIRYRINRHWEVQAGGNITHISNGSFRKPNLGVNMAGGHLGIRYFPVTSAPAHRVQELPPLKGRYLFQVRGGMSLVSANTAGGPLYPVYLATAYVSRRWHNNNKLFAGIDYSYHRNVYAFLHNNRLEAGKEARRSYKSAVLAGNEFMIGRVGVTLQAGVYIKQAYLYAADIYEKIGGSYYFVLKEHGPLKELFLFTYLKTHLSVAELGEMGLGVGF